MKISIEEIRAKFEEPLYNLVCSKMGRLDSCQDLLQEVFIKIIQNLDKIEKVENVTPYLNKIARNTVADYHRSAKHKMANLCENEISSSPAISSDEKTYELATFMLEMIDKLPTIYRHALVEVELKGISQTQLAEDLGISYSGLKSRVQRAREMLRQSITDCCDYKFDPYGNVVSCCGQEFC